MTAITAVTNKVITGKILSLHKDTNAKTTTFGVEIDNPYIGQRFMIADQLDDREQLKAELRIYVFDTPEAFSAVFNNFLTKKDLNFHIQQAKLYMKANEILFSQDKFYLMHIHEEKLEAVSA